MINAAKQHLLVAWTRCHAAMQTFRIRRWKNATRCAAKLRTTLDVVRRLYGFLEAPTSLQATWNLMILEPKNTFQKRDPSIPRYPPASLSILFPCTAFVHVKVEMGLELGLVQCDSTTCRARVKLIVKLVMIFWPANSVAR